MFEYFTGLRYLLSRSRVSLSIISIISILGVALGVMALVSVVTVASGFEETFRDKVLGVGGSRDAADSIQDFLGRPYNLDAFKAWLAE